MTLPTSFLDDLRARVAVSSVVGRRVRLARHGREYQGLCPFHNEKSPSFTVSDDKGFFHCFGCGAHGDVVDFVMRTDHLSFMESVELLAADAGLEVPKVEHEDRASEVRRGGLLEALDAAAQFFADELSKGGDGLTYLHGRGLTDETIARFRLGWAPGRDGLRRVMVGTRFPESLLLEAGLLRQREDGSIGDLFRERVMFPITDRRGRVVAFGARTLGDGQPKYLNSPATPVFDKGTTLYGLAHAREGAGREGCAVAVEGYMDVIALHQAGLPFAVAPLGTALTERHLAELWRLAPEPVLCLDGDAAGQKAMRRTADRALPLLEPGKTLRFAVLPAEHDPDSLVRAAGAEGFRAVMDESRPLVDVVWDAALVDFPPDFAERRAAFERSLMASVAMIANPAMRRVVLGDFRQRLRTEGASVAPVTFGRGKIAPPAAADCLQREWARACGHAEIAAVRGWLERYGINWDALIAACGGVGFAHGKPLKGKSERAEDGVIGPVSLWEHAPDGLGMVVLPVWEGAPERSVLLDLIAWEPRTGSLHSRTGQVVVLGEAVIAEALAFEGKGLVGRVAIAASPLAWLQRLSAGESPVLVVDWRRAWSALGGLGGLVADSVELGEKLDKHVRPPPLPRPSILVAAL